MKLMTISIGGVDYTVHLFDEDYREDYGVCLPTHQRIYLSREQSWQQVGNTLLHEVLHAIYHESGLGTIDKPEEETIVYTVGTWLSMVMRQNRHLGKFIANPRKYWSFTPTTDPYKEATR